MINALSRPLPLVVCLLLTLMPGLDAAAQRILPQNIIRAEQLNGDQMQVMREYVDARMADLISGESERVSDAREGLLQPLNKDNELATVVFYDAYSTLIRDRMGPAIGHNDVLVRMNAMMVLGGTTDVAGLQMVMAGLGDENVGVQRWAMQGVQNRAAWWSSERGANPLEVRNAIEQADTYLTRNPGTHPIVVSPAMEMFFEVNSPLSRSTLMQQLNARVALHAADPNLSYSGEQEAVRLYTGEIALANQFDRAASRGVAQACFRHSLQIARQLQADAVNNANTPSAVDMLTKSLRGLELINAGAGRRAPGNQGVAITEWIPDREWDQVVELLEDSWGPILSAAPFNLTEQEIEIPAAGSDAASE